MTVERFTLDANILVYSLDSTGGAKHDLAAEIVKAAARRPCVLTFQSLAETYWAVSRKNIAPRAEIAAQIGDWMEIFPCAAVDAEALLAATAPDMAGRFSFWNALYLATAERAGCTLALSEDMHDGAAFGGLRVRSPFARAGLPAELRELLGLG
jgi:predicted nucleic acid-binding protein